MKLFLALFAVGLLAGLGLRSLVRDDSKPSAPAPVHAHEHPEPTGLLVDLGNTVCPVMGNEVTDEGHFIEWKHLRVGFCCPGCDKTFLRDPENVLDDGEIPWREAAAAVEAYLAAEGVHREHALAEIKGRWKVIRE